METLNYKVLAETGYNGYVLKDAPVKVMQFGEGNFLRAFVDYFIDIANEKAGFNGKVKPAIYDPRPPAEAVRTFQPADQRQAAPLSLEEQEKLAEGFIE